VAVIGDALDTFVVWMEMEMEMMHFGTSGSNLHQPGLTYEAGSVKYPGIHIDTKRKLANNYHNIIVGMHALSTGTNITV
jgi:hypothetical protein